MSSKSEGKKGNSINFLNFIFIFINIFIFPFLSFPSYIIYFFRRITVNNAPNASKVIPTIKTKEERTSPV